MANLAAEKVFLAGVVRHPLRLFDFLEYLSEEDFKHAATRITFEALRSLITTKEAEKITKSKLVAEAKALGHQNYLSVTKDGVWIDELIAEEVATHELEAHFLEVKRQSLKEAYAEAFGNLKDYLDTTDDHLSVMIGKVESEIISKVNLIDKGEHAVVDVRDGFKEFITSLADDPGHMGLDLGYPLWQERIGHIRNGGVTFVVGTTGSGKSQFGTKAAVIAARKKLPVLILDSELNKNEQWIRIAAMLTKIPSQYIETGFWRMTEDDLRRHGVKDQNKVDEIIAYGARLRDQRLWDAIEQMPLFYQSISGLSVSDVIPHMRRWVLTHVKPDRETRVPQCLIVYDYIKLSMTEEIKSGILAEWQQHGLHVAAIHDFAKQYNIPIIAFGQTNNEADEGLRCVAGGKRISENVTSVSYFKRKTDQERALDSNGTHLVKIFKARFGSALWGSYINYDADLSCGDFKELDLASVRSQDDNDDSGDEEESDS